MTIITLTDKKLWLDFLMTSAGASGLEFLASPKWAEIMEREGKTVLPLGALDAAGNLSALVCLVKETLPAGFFYWYAPRGPIFKSGISGGVNGEEAAEITRALILKLRTDYPKTIFLKIEPAQNVLQVASAVQFLENDKLAATGRVVKMKPVPAPDIQPQKTLILDLKNSAADLLAAMHQKTRYNIRLAEKKGVRIVLGSAADFKEFWRLMNLTGERDGFHIHSQKHYQNLLAADADFIKIFFAEYEGRKIAAALVCYFGTQATYLHGASDNQYRNVMAPYLLQWEMIKQAQSAGATIYDFYGINEQKWPGVTRFKLGFGGEVRAYFGVYDLVLRPGIYQLYQGLKKLKRIWR